MARHSAEPAPSDAYRGADGARPAGGSASFYALMRHHGWSETDRGVAAVADQYVQATTMTDSQDEADTLTRGAVEARLAACGQVLGGVTSTYWWRGEIETATEWMVVLKTTVARYPALEEFIRRRHSYDTPDITAIPISAGSAEYLAWVSEETRG